VTNKNRTALEQRKCCGRGNNWADNLLFRNHSQQSLYVAGIADQLYRVVNILWYFKSICEKMFFFVGMSCLFVRTPLQVAI